MSIQSIDKQDFTGKTVLLRLDLNVPAEKGIVSDHTRIDRVRETVQYLSKSADKVLILSHFGRPKGEIDPAYSMKFLPSALEASWGMLVEFLEEPIGSNALEERIGALAKGSIALLENIRFYKGEESNDTAFCQHLAELGDVYINDAFSVSHRAHASTEGLARLLPSYAGFCLMREVEALDKVLTSPNRPLAAVVGGAKISTKLDILTAMVEKVDTLILGGAMANTFLMAQGYDVGRSLLENDMLDTAKSIMDKAKAQNCTLLLPRDVRVAKALEAGVPHRDCQLDDIKPDEMILDLGPDSVAHINQLLDSTQTLLWNGPLGAFEVQPFDEATCVVASHAAALTQQNGLFTSIAGGGDTASALTHAGVTDKFSYLSTAGGAFLEMIEGKTLPGLKALEDAQAKAA